MKISESNERISNGIIKNDLHGRVEMRAENDTHYPRENAGVDSPFPSAAVSEYD